MAARLRAGVVVACLAGGSAFLVALLPGQAQALELFGYCLLGRCDKDSEQAQIIDPTPYEVEVVVTGDDPALDDVVKSASGLWQNRDSPAHGSAGLISRGQGDYQRILAALYNEGRYGGEISITVGGREFADLPPGFVFDGTAQVQVSVDPSVPFRFGEAVIEPVAPAPMDHRDRVEPPAGIGFSPGEIAKATTVRKAGRLAVDAWREQGHAKADIVAEDIKARHDTNLLNVRLGIDPGPKAYYGDVTVSGTERMIPSFVARQTGLIPGHEYDPDDIERAKERIRRLGVFSAQSLKEADEIAADGTLPFELVVQERKLRRIGIGATYSTLDGFGGEAFWLHRNLFGRAERLKLEASASGLGQTVDYQQFDYSAGATFTMPGRFTPDTDITSRLFARREVLDAYTKTGVEASLEAKQYLTPSIELDASVFVTYAKFERQGGTERFGVIGVSAGATFDNRDNDLDPTEGFFAKTSLTPFYEWKQGNAGLQFDSDVRGYVGFGDEGATVLAARLKFGSILGPDAGDIPPDRLYLAGGGSSVRGYPYRSIGASGEGDDTVGGKSLIEGSVEIRHRFTETIGAAAFVDFAQVSNDTIPDFENDTRFGAGIGLRYYTALGPIRLDVAVPLNKRDGDSDFALYSGIGQAF